MVDKELTFVTEKGTRAFTVLMFRVSGIDKNPRIEFLARDAPGKTTMKSFDINGLTSIVTNFDERGARINCASISETKDGKVT